MQQNRVI